MRRIALSIVGILSSTGCTKDEPAPAKPPIKSSESKTVKAAPPVESATPPAKTEAKTAAKTTLDRETVAALFKPLPTEVPSDSNPITPEKVALGKMLYFEKRISKNHDISCNSCHDVARFGVDNEATSPGHKGVRGERNSPTTFNAAGHFVQFWDGREPDVEAQAKGPVLNSVEMAMPDGDTVLAVLRSMPEYVAAFKAAFPGEADPLTYDNFGRAVGAYERKLVTPAPFDAYLKGDDKALTAEQQEGLANFIAAGCVACHSGTYLGGAMYQKLGLVKAWPGLTDKGVGAHTKNADQDYFFKVPSLRNITQTGPYLHDGSVKDLGKLVGMMAQHQMGKTLEPDQVTSIVKFLESLTGTLDPALAKAPTLPASTDKTPKPDPT